MYVRSITDDKTKPPEDNLRITFIKVSKEQIRVRIQNSTGLLILTGRPVDQPAGWPAFLSILAGQNWPKLKMLRK